MDYTEEEYFKFLEDFDINHKEIDDLEEADDYDLLDYLR